MPHTLDAPLVAAAGGDLSAFSVVYDELAPRAYGLALRILGDSHLAEAAVCESFIDAWRHSRSFDPKTGSADSWILARVHRCAVDRGRSHLARHGPRDVTSPLPRHPFTPAPPAVRAQTNPLERQALELAYLDGLTCRDISRHLNLRLAAVSRLLRQGLHNINPTTSPPLTGA